MGSISFDLAHFSERLVYLNECRVDMSKGRVHSSPIFV
jgi:hypothetical protein